MALQVKREMAASNREEAQALVESQLAQSQRLQRSAQLAKAQGHVIHQEKRIFQSAESIEHRQAIYHTSKIIHHGKYSNLGDPSTQAVMNQARQQEVETMKQFKARCLSQMRNQNLANERCEVALKLQQQQDSQALTSPEHYFNDLMNIDQQNDRLYRVKNRQSVRDLELEEIQDSFEEIFTMGSEATQSQRKIPTPVWTIPAKVEVFPVHENVQKPASSSEKVKAPVWIIPASPPRNVTVARFPHFQQQLRPQFTPSSIPLPPPPELPSYDDVKEGDSDRQSYSPPATSREPPSRDLPQLEIHLSPTTMSHGSEVME